TLYHYIQCQLQFIRLVSFSETLVNGSTVSYRIPATYSNSSFFIIFNCSSTSSSFLPIRRWPAPSLLQVLGEGDIHVEGDAGNKRNEEGLLSCDLGGLEL
ncbi:hypothetical protein PENTCL1PPCAC_20812, partial [Pristionchus entomophagus]